MRERIPTNRRNKNAGDEGDQIAKTEIDYWLADS